jgi:hypothetical protein
MTALGGGPRPTGSSPSCWTGCADRTSPTSVPISPTSGYGHNRRAASTQGSPDQQIEGQIPLPTSKPHIRTPEPVIIADLDTLLTALYAELTDRIIPARGLARRGPGRAPEVTDAELACLAVAQVLLRHDGERHWLRAAPGLVGHLFPRLLARASTTPGCVGSRR